MTAENIVDKIIVYLDQHIRGARGFIGQTPYKDDFFKLFLIAYENHFFDTDSNPCLTGDGIYDIVKTRWVSEGLDSEAEELKLLDDLCKRWREWKFAIDKFIESKKSRDL